MSHKPYFFTLISFATLLSGCGVGNGEFSEFKPLPTQGWSYEDTLQFATDSVTPSHPTALMLSVANTDDYPYSNLWLEITSRDNGGRQYRDTVNVKLADVTGHWLGQGFGASYQLKQKVRDLIPQPSSQVLVRHIMRMDTVKGLLRIGINNE